MRLNNYNRKDIPYFNGFWIIALDNKMVIKIND